MAQEDKSLLLKDLSSRLPYNVICADSRHGDSRITEIDVVEKTVYCYDFDEYAELDKIKPYLRPMSSMTMEEKKELFQLMGGGTDIKRIDFYISHHLDYRGLIEKGLALEAPEGMY
jgi:hypothetical protein